MATNQKKRKKKKYSSKIEGSLQYEFHYLNNMDLDTKDYMPIPPKFQGFLKIWASTKGICEGLKVKIQKAPSNIAPLREMIVHPSSYEIKS